MSNPWDIPLKPKPGERLDLPDDLYAAVGKALSSWDGVESTLARIFALCCQTPIFGNPLGEPAIRAYGSVVSFNGRAEMVDAASRAYFHNKKAPTAEIEMKLRGLLSECRQFAGRRNDIAHGRVEFLLGAEYDWWPQGEREHCWLFLPGLLSTKRYSLDHEPTYIYMLAELTYFKDQFDNLAGRISELEGDLWKIYSSP